MTCQWCGEGTEAAEQLFCPRCRPEALRRYLNAVGLQSAQGNPGMPGSGIGGHAGQAQANVQSPPQGE
jgi:hypothetical protein